MISDWILLLLRIVSSKKLPPTVTARWLFIFTSLIHDGYQYVTGNNRPLDLFPKTNDTYSVSDMQNWIDTVCNLSYTLVRDKIGSTQDPINFTSIYLETELWDKWKSRAIKYVKDRDDDGWKISSTISGTIPNSGEYIVPTNTGLPSLEDATKWTALTVDGKNQSYLTPEWGSVKGVVGDDDFTSLLEMAQRYYPDSEIWDKEIKEVYDISTSLTDKQKTIAEFWAGGPSSVTPPGFWFVFSYAICKSNSLPISEEIKLYTLLGMAVFQGSICAWKLKRQNLQARPVQMIRQAGLDESWVPYQESNFVTPPFPDFVSGHSVFSSVSSRIIYQILQKNQIDLKGTVLDSELLKLLNPELFANTDNTVFNLCEIAILPDSSNIENGVPLSGVSLSWSGLDQMAEEAGLSRIYGGIHYQSSNRAGLSLGRQLSNILCEKYKFVLTFNAEREGRNPGTKFYKI